jgi:hypothetical protein
MTATANVPPALPPAELQAQPHAEQVVHKVGCDRCAEVQDGGLSCS